MIARRTVKVVPYTELCLYFHMAAETDIRFNVKSYATSGNIGNLLRHGKARQKQQIDDLFLAHCLSLLLSDDTGCDCLVAHSLHVDSVTVIANLDDDIIPFLKCVEENA